MFESDKTLSLCFHTISKTAFSRGVSQRNEIPKLNELFTNADDLQLSRFYFRQSQSVLSCLGDAANGKTDCLVYGKDPNNYVAISNKVHMAFRFWPTLSMVPNEKDIWIGGGLGVKMDLKTHRAKSLFVYDMVTLIR